MIQTETRSPGNCYYSICPVSSGVNRIRLDFQVINISKINTEKEFKEKSLKMD